MNKQARWSGRKRRYFSFGLRGCAMWTKALSRKVVDGGSRYIEAALSEESDGVE